MGDMLNKKIWGGGGTEEIQIYFKTQVIDHVN